MSSEASTTFNNQDASSKWSGYNYQGKVALYVALYLINNPEHLSKTEEENWNTFALEIEGLEDFCILKNNEYISIHQVKAYESSNSISNFKNALWGLLGKTIEHQSIQKSCLHTLSKVKQLRDRTEDNKTKIKGLVPTKDLEKKYKKDYIDDNDRLECAFDKLVFYDHHNLYRIDVELDEINNLVKEEIKKYYLMNNFESDKTQSDYLDGIFNKLLYELDIYVYKRHKKELKQSDYIYFGKIIEYLNSGIDLATHEYFLLKLRRFVGENTLEYCRYCIKGDEWANEKCELCNIISYKNEDIWFNNTKFIDFIRTINLHIPFDREILDMEDILKITSYIHGYNSILETIKEYSEYDGISDNKIKYEKNTNKYISTSISHLQKSKNGKESEAKDISQNIIKNIESDAKLLSDLDGVNILISDNVNVASIRRLENKIGKNNLIESDPEVIALKAEYELIDKSFGDLSIIPYNDFLEECEV